MTRSWKMRFPEKKGFLPMIMKGKQLNGYCYVEPIGFKKQTILNTGLKYVLIIIHWRRGEEVSFGLEGWRVGAFEGMRVWWRVSGFRGFGFGGCFRVGE